MRTFFGSLVSLHSECATLTMQLTFYCESLQVTPATSKQSSQHVHVSSHVRAGSDAGSLLKDALLEVELQRHDDEDDRCGSTECSEPRAHMISSNSSP